MILDAASKLLYHSDRVHEILTRGYTNPVHLTVGLTNYCSHRCTWCYIDWVHGRQTNPFNTDIEKLLAALKDAHRMGAKAITISGDGEPALHPQFDQFLERANRIGLDVGVFTNGSWKRPHITNALVDHTTFVRFSIDAGSPEVHRELHRAKDFDRIIDNIRDVMVARSSRVNRDGPTVGVQFAFNHNNIHDTLRATHLFKSLGTDYIAFKPVYRNDLNTTHETNEVNPESVARALSACKVLEDDGFKVLWKSWQTDALVFDKHRDRDYTQCLAIWLSPYIDSNGSVEFCGNLKGRGFSIGNVFENCFEDIWGGEIHRQKIKDIRVERCPAGCKLHGLNTRLWQLKNPRKEQHVNFI